MRGFYGWKYNRGDGIKIAQKVGADLWHMQQVCGDDAWFDDPDIVPGGVRCQPHAELHQVNRLGELGREGHVEPHGSGSPTPTSTRDLRLRPHSLLVRLRPDVVRGRQLGRHGRRRREENGGMGISCYMTEGLGDPSWADGKVGRPTTHGARSADGSRKAPRSTSWPANLAKSKWDDKMDADKLKASVERERAGGQESTRTSGARRWARSRPAPSHPSTPASATPSAAHAGEYTNVVD